MNVVWIVIGSVMSSTVLTALITKWFDRRRTATESARNEAEAADLLSQAWERSMKNLTTQMEIQQKRIYDLEQKLEIAYVTIADLKDHIDDLEKELRRRRKDDDNGN